MSPTTATRTASYAMLRETKSFFARSTFLFGHTRIAHNAFNGYYYKNMLFLLLELMPLPIATYIALWNVLHISSRTQNLCLCLIKRFAIIFWIQGNIRQFSQTLRSWIDCAAVMDFVWERLEYGARCERCECESTKSKFVLWRTNALITSSEKSNFMKNEQEMNREGERDLTAQRKLKRERVKTSRNVQQKQYVQCVTFPAKSHLVVSSISNTIQFFTRPKRVENRIGM